MPCTCKGLSFRLVIDWGISRRTWLESTYCSIEYLCWVVECSSGGGTILLILLTDETLPRSLYGIDSCPPNVSGRKPRVNSVSSGTACDVRGGNSGQPCHNARGSEQWFVDIHQAWSLWSKSGCGASCSWSSLWWFECNTLLHRSYSNDWDVTFWLVLVTSAAVSGSGQVH